MYGGLVTMVFDTGHTRLQWHIMTDSKEQYVEPIKKWLQTQQELGQPGIKFMATDNPVGDDAFFRKAVPSLQGSQDILDSLAPPADISVSVAAGASVRCGLVLRLLPCISSSFKR